MCKENKECFIILLVVLLLSCVVGVLQGEEPGPWYLISENELQSIEVYKKKSEAERQNWLLQVSDLKTQAERLNARAANSLAESESLNQQLRKEREANRKLTLSFNEYETAASRTISQKDMHIGVLEAENEKVTGQRNTMLAIVITAGIVVLGFVVFKVLRFFRVIPI
jgi:hypothetical protein